MSIPNRPGGPLPPGAQGVDPAPTSDVTVVDPAKLTPEQRARREAEANLRLDRTREDSAQALALLIAFFFKAKEEALEARERSQAAASTERGEPEIEPALSLSDGFLRAFSRDMGVDERQFRDTVARVQSGETTAVQAAQQTLRQAQPAAMDLARAEETVRRHAAKGHPILEVIAAKESGGNYNIAWGGKVHAFTSMTVDQVIAWQEEQIRQGTKSTAVGKYQFINKTLEGLRDEFARRGENIGNKLFDEEMQERLGMALLERRGYRAFLRGDKNMPEDRFMRNLSQEWAAAPKDMGGKSFYDGDGLNKAHIKPEVMLVAMRAARDLADTPASPLQQQFAQGGVPQRPSGPANPSVLFNTGGRDQVALAPPVSPDHPGVGVPPASPAPGRKA